MVPKEVSDLDVGNVGLEWELNGESQGLCFGLHSECLKLGPADVCVSEGSRTKMKWRERTSACYRVARKKM